MTQALTATITARGTPAETMITRVVAVIIMRMKSPDAVKAVMKKAAQQVDAADVQVAIQLLQSKARTLERLPEFTTEEPLTTEQSLILHMREMHLLSLFAVQA